MYTLPENAQIPKIFTHETSTMPSPEPRVLMPVDCRTFKANYVILDSFLTIQLFRDVLQNERWEYEDGKVLWDKMLEAFHLQGREAKLQVEFVPELYSWCIRAVDVGVVQPVPPEKVERVIRSFEEGESRLSFTGE